MGNPGFVREGKDSGHGLDSSSMEDIDTGGQRTRVPYPDNTKALVHSCQQMNGTVARVTPVLALTTPQSRLCVPFACNRRRAPPGGWGGSLFNRSCSGLQEP